LRCSGQPAPDSDFPTPSALLCSHRSHPLQSRPSYAPETHPASLHTGPLPVTAQEVKRCTNPYIATRRIDAG
jgi:hypothetical protein